jgi:hypothetical protein
MIGVSLMSINSDRLASFIEDRLSWELAPYEDVNVGGIAEDIAYDLKSHGYCSEPYFSYEKALICPINKRREKQCNCTTCESYQFCAMLRKEGYV